MSSWTKGLILALLCTFGTAAFGQVEQGIVAKKLFIDYKSPNGGDLFDFKEWHSGFEMGYLRRLNDQITLVIPMKVAVTQQSDSLYNDVMVALEGQIQYELVSGKTWTPYVASGVGLVTENFNEAHAVVPLMFGANLNLTKKTKINFEAGYRLGLADNRDNVQLGLGFIHIFGPPSMDSDSTMKKDPKQMDSDGDGIVDEIDVCPQVPGLDKFLGCPDTDSDGIQDSKDDCPEVPGTEAMMGCPDTDGDGVSDKDDECPNLPGSIANKGCPDRDSDGDGIMDAEDDCPNQAGTVSNGGCPEVDSDSDGIVDSEDDCPDQPGTITLKGCPDTDGDGVSDKDDECPNLVGSINNNGCPDPGATDRDGDGVLNADDDCPDEAGPRALSGCPDSDGDGVADDDDACPDQPGARVNLGCPDTDGDGVVDKDDRCPNTVGTIANKGCPEIRQEERAILEFAVQNVEFDLGKSTLKSSSFSVLNQIAEIVKRYPAYTLRISGHTDNIGNDSFNQRLSEQRARSCYEYLSGRGISTSRMTYIGYGEDRPVADNNTDEGRQRNRRVEFDLYVE